MRQVAVKVIKEVYGAQPHTIERKLKRERTTWALLRHPNILPLWGFANDHELFEPFGALISPWRAQGNACDFLKGRGKELTKDQRLDMWEGVVAGVEYLHNHTPVLVHGDLKLANIMIDNQYSPQICDFGLVSIFLEEGHSGMTTTSNHTGTDRYLAYELVCDGDTVIPTVASDIFALGCVGLELYFLQAPYANRKNNMQGRIFADIRAGIQPATPDAGCDAEAQQIWNLLGQCWEHNPKQRPSAGDLLASLQLRQTQANGNPNILPQGAASLHREISARSLGMLASPTAYMEDITGPIFQPSTDRGHQSDMVFSAPLGYTSSDPNRKEVWGANGQLPYQPLVHDSLPIPDVNLRRGTPNLSSANMDLSANTFTPRGGLSPALYGAGNNSRPQLKATSTPTSTTAKTQERLERVLGPSSALTNEALLMLLRLIIEPSLFWEHGSEPTISSPSGQALLRLVRSMPDCPYEAFQLSENSIFTLFVAYPDFRCLICGHSKQSMARGIDCIRWHLDHKTYACHGGGEGESCPKDLMVENPFAASRLGDHRNKKLPLHDNYGASQAGTSLDGISGHQIDPQHPPFNYTMTYPPHNPVPNLQLSGTSNLGRNNSNSKQKQQGQWNEVDERKLADAFMPGSFRHDLVLWFFLDLIRRCSFYLEDEHEPLLGTPEAEQIFAQVRARYPHDLRFTSRNDPRFSSQPLGNETRASRSIFILLTEKNQCLICGAQKDRTGRALGHVRSDIGHRPYHCNCDECMQRANPRRFFSENLLDDHLKGQQVKQKCVYCHNLFRRGGMKRHLTSKHPEHAQGDQENDDHED